jgi:hypothetical protein
MGCSWHFNGMANGRVPLKYFSSIHRFLRLMGQVRNLDSPRDNRESEIEYPVINRVLNGTMQAKLLVFVY